MMSGEELSERLVVGLESFLSLGAAFLSTVFAQNIPPLSSPAICHLYGSDTPTTEFFLETVINEDDDVCVASDWIVLMFQFLAIHAFHWWSRWLLWEPLARLYFGNNRLLRVQKFSQTLVANLIHVMMAVFAWRILVDQDWLTSPKQWSMGVEDPTVAPDVKFYYLLYAARYTSDLISLHYEHKRSDTWAYAVHHVISIALVLGSAVAGYIRIGCVLMFFFDWADPFMLTAKLCQYLSCHREDGFQFASNRLFEVFGVVFCLTRNILLTYVVWVIWKDFPESAWIFKGGCLLLVALQTFWLYNIVKTAMHQFRNRGHVDDIRSDSEDEEEEEEQARIARKKGN